jgi:hypothetical protein
LKKNKKNKNKNKEEVVLSRDRGGANPLFDGRAIIAILMGTTT